MRGVRRPGVMVGITMLLWLAAAGVASARPLVHEHFHDVTSEVIEDFCDIEGLTIREDIDVRGMTLINSRGPDELAFFHETVRGSFTWTNVATGRSMHQEFTINDKDLSVTDNGDGTFTALVLNTGGFKLFGPDGQRLKDSGQIRFELLLDAQGEFLDFLGIVKESTGTNDLEGRDFCTDVQDFIG